MRRLIPLLVALAFPGVAHAGCVAVPAHAPAFIGSGVIYADPGYRCTTGNGAVYELRSYIQTLTATGQWRIDTRADRHQLPVYPPAYSHRRYRDFWQCSEIAPNVEHWRVKAVLENAVTNRVSIVYSPASVPTAGCA